VFVTGQLAAGSPAAGALYIVMEHVDGISLRSKLAAAGGAIQLPRALRIILQLCDAVGEAHARGIVHRDIKPENVMLVRRGGDADFVKVLDFGMARMPAGSGPALTKAGLVFGTARYISPEGAAGQPVGPPADVYAIVTVLYQTLAGCTPFEGETAVEVLARQINEPPRPVRSQPRGSYVPEPIAELIAQNLAKKPEDRFPDARALGRALLDAARAAGLAPEALVARSALLGEPSHEPAFVSAAPTRQLAFGTGLAGRVGAASPNGTAPIAADDPRRPTSGSDRHPMQASRMGTRGTLAFLLACVAAGVALAAIGIRLRAAGTTGDSARATAATRGEGPTTVAIADAGVGSIEGGFSSRPVR
jgi:eukaryotic-like serine/threonine-protein kinase